MTTNSLDSTHHHHHHHHLHTRREVKGGDETNVVAVVALPSATCKGNNLGHEGERKDLKESTSSGTSYFWLHARDWRSFIDFVQCTYSRYVVVHSIRRAWDVLARRTATLHDRAAVQNILNVSVLHRLFCSAIYPLRAHSSLTTALREERRRGAFIRSPKADKSLFHFFSSQMVVEGGGRFSSL